MKKEDKITEKGLYETLIEYSRADILPMHMPGHKRNPAFMMENPYKIDVTEVEGLDNLHCPQGMIRRLMERITAMYHSEQSYLLVNGSTGGILSAIAACCRHNDRILVARNCHKSVYHAIRLLELRPVYLYPDAGGGEIKRLGIAGVITAESVKDALGRYDDIACVIVTSPTYEGVVSPVRQIAEVVHSQEIPLLVDEAHGAHFNWHEAFPETALAEGADVVVESLHKTLPALTQTGVLHARFDRVSRERLEWCLQTFQSSSPSYILMAGIDRCFAYIEEEGKEAFGRYAGYLHSFRERMKTLTHLYLFDSPDKEPSKLVIATDRSPLTGRGLAHILREGYRIETEMSCGNYCIAMTSVCDGKENFSRLIEALREIDLRFCGRKNCEGSGRTEKKISGKNSGFYYNWQVPECRMYSWQAAECPVEWICMDEAEGRVSAEDICLYPPGIPLIVQGEVFSQEVLKILRDGKKCGDEIQGMEQDSVKVNVNRTTKLSKNKS